MEDFKVGDKVKWKAAGKVARLEGKAGQIVTGVVTSLDLLQSEGMISVMADHRKVQGAMFFEMGSVVFAKDLKHA